MTVNTVETRKTYTGNGVTDAYATPYFLVDADLAVYVDGVLQTITTDYTVTGAGVAGGGTVTFVTPPPAPTAPVTSGNVVIIRDPAQTQLLDLVENDRNPAEAREQAFDKLTMIAQRLADRINRVVQLSDTDTATTLTVPELADRLSKYLAFDASGNLIAAAGSGETPISSFMATVVDDTDAATALTTLGFSAFVQTLLDDADAGAFKDTLRIGASAPPHNFTADADYTLTATQEQYDRIVFTDTGAVLTGPVNVDVSTAQRERIYQNDTAQTLTIKTSAGTGIPVVAGTSRPLICDGTNVVDPLAASLPAVRGMASNYRASADGVSANIAITADEIVVEDASGNYRTLRNVSETLNTAGSGANGLDTGTIAASTWYYKFIIWGSAGTAALCSLSATAPTLPAGYTYWARTGSFRTDGTANKYPLSMTWVDGYVEYVIATGSNVVAYPPMAVGAQGTYNQTSAPVWASVGVGSFVPPTATRIHIGLSNAYNNQSISDVAAAPNNSFSGTATTNPPPANITTAIGATFTPFTFVLESASVYMASSAAGAAMLCIGWEE